MVKKLKTPAEDDSQFASAVRNSAAQIWQAGLGAFAKAQEEGNRMFARLVREGTALQEKSRAMAGERLGDMPGNVSKMASGFGQQAAGSLDKLEQVFEDRVARALATIGVPNKRDIQDLADRVEQLSKLVAELSGKKAALRPARAAKAAGDGAARKATAAKAAAKGNGTARKAAAAKAAAKGDGTARKAARSTTAKAAAKPAAKRGAAKAAAKGGAATVAARTAARKSARKPGQAAAR